MKFPFTTVVFMLLGISSSVAAAPGNPEMDTVKRAIDSQIELLSPCSIAYRYELNGGSYDCIFEMDGASFYVASLSRGARGWITTPVATSWNAASGGVIRRSVDRVSVTRNRTEVISQTTCPTPLHKWLYFLGDALQLEQAKEWTRVGHTYKLTKAKAHDEHEITLEFEEPSTKARQVSVHNMRQGGWPKSMQFFCPAPMIDATRT